MAVAYMAVAFLSRSGRLQPLVFFFLNVFSTRVPKPARRLEAEDSYDQKEGKRNIKAAR